VTGSVAQVRHGNGDNTRRGASFADGAEERTPFSTIRQTEGNIFDIAAGVNRSIVKKQRSTDAELRVWRIGVMSSGFGRLT
jgi:hypothetical protein